MSKVFKGVYVLTFMAALACRSAWCYVVVEPKKGDFPLVSNSGEVATIVVDEDASFGTLRAVADLQSDIEKVTGERPPVVKSFTETTGAVLVIGEIGQSELLKQVEKAKLASFQKIDKQWDAYQISHLPASFQGANNVWVIAGANKRGVAYGIYDLSEKIGVSPWYWWADVPVRQRKSIYLQSGTSFHDAPAVKYRGIFLNDEAPALTNWSQEKFGGYNADFYEHVFELLLRLKANFLWPAMWNNAFADDDPRNAVLADEMGIVMSTSHHEPMMRADKEWNRYGEGPWEYSTNAEKLYAFWEEGAERYKNKEGLFTLGMRGQEDTPMSEGQNIELLEKVVRDQRRILADTFPERPLSEVPQVWTLYKEVQDFYEKGMRVPDDVTLLWADDNFGNIRRLPTEKERERAGGAGVYYHFDYVGGPRSYRWINTVPLGKIWDQMQLAWQYGAREIWIVNVGDLKPMELPIDFFLSMAWEPSAFDSTSPDSFVQQWAAQQFGDDHAASIASLLKTYSLHNGRRKPEALHPTTYSINHNQEAERVSEQLHQAADLAKNVAEELDEPHQSAFFQLVGYPLWATQAVYELNYQQALNQQYAFQQRANTNQKAEEVKKWFSRDEQLTRQYHSLDSGRWNHMMSQPHIGYVHWRNPPANIPPAVTTRELASPAVADMGVSVEGSDLWWPANTFTGEALALRPFTRYGAPTQIITVYNRQAQPFDFNAKPDKEWIRLSQSSGTVEDSVDIKVSIDWARLDVGDHKCVILIEGTGWGGAKVAVSATSTDLVPVGFTEADGYLALNATSGHTRQQSEQARWMKVAQHGLTGEAMRAYVDLSAAPDVLEAPYLEFEVFFTSTGEFPLHFQLSPTLQFHPNNQLNFAYALNDQEPVMLSGGPEASNADWETEVLNNIRRVSTTLAVPKAGAHKLRVYLQDAGVVLQRIFVDTGGLQPSYIGPPQSPLIEG